MKYILYCIIVCQCYYATAQKQNSKAVFSSVNNVALVVGEAKNAFAVQTKNGFKKDKWFAGIGSGFDFYEKRTIPLFLALQRDFFNGPKKLFVYTDAGINFRWLQSTDYLYKSSTSKPGVYYEFGMGYKVVFKNNTSLNFSAGYNLKQVKETYNPYWYVQPVQPVDPLLLEKYNSSFRRIIIRLGLTI